MARSWLTKAAFVASDTGGASFNIPHGAAPSSPVDGDVWTTTAGLFARINTATKGPFLSPTDTLNDIAWTSSVGTKPLVTLTGTNNDIYPVGIKFVKTAATVTSSTVVGTMLGEAKDSGGNQRTSHLFDFAVVAQNATSVDGSFKFQPQLAGVSVAALTLSGVSAAFGVPVLAPAATTAIPSIRLPHGAAPSAPTNGDIWTTTAGIYVRINGGTVGPLGAAGGSYVDTTTNQSIAGIKTFTDTGGTVMAPSADAANAILTLKRFTDSFPSSPFLRIQSAAAGNLYTISQDVLINHVASANGQTMQTLTRFTDTSPTGSFLTFKNAASGTIASIGILGTYNAPASTTAGPSLNLPHGSAPSSPTNGDMWTTTAGVYTRTNGTTYRLWSNDEGFLTMSAASGSSIPYITMFNNDSGDGPAVVDGYKSTTTASSLTVCLRLRANAKATDASLNMCAFLELGVQQKNATTVDGIIRLRPYLSGAAVDALSVTGSAATFTVPMIAATATTSIPSLRIPHGTAPSSPTNGDVWTTSSGVFVRVTGVTYGLITRHSQVFSRAGDLVVTTGAFRWYCEYAGSVLGARATVTTAPTGSSAIFDVLKNGTSLWNTTPANRPTITATNFTSGFVTNMDTGATVTAGDYFTVDIDQIGSTIAGANLTVTLWLNLA